MGDWASETCKILKPRVSCRLGIGFGWVLVSIGGPKSEYGGPERQWSDTVVTTIREVLSTLRQSGRLAATVRECYSAVIYESNILTMKKEYVRLRDGVAQ